MQIKKLEVTFLKKVDELTSSMQNQQVCVSEGALCIAVQLPSLTCMTTAFHTRLNLELNRQKIQTESKLSYLVLVTPTGPPTLTYHMFQM